MKLYLQISLILVIFFKTGNLLSDNYLFNVNNILLEKKENSSSKLLADKAIKTFTVNNSNLEAPLHRNPILVTALNPIIGYEKAAQIAKEAYRENQPILDVAQKYCNLSREELVKLLDPLKLTNGGL